MNPCDRCKRPMDLKCCHNCKKDAAECDVWHDCGKDCPKWEAQIQTNADRIRAMSDEELAQQLLLFTDLDDRIRYCKDLPECQKALDDDVEIPADRCKSCLLSWLQQPAEEVTQ